MIAHQHWNTEDKTMVNERNTNALFRKGLAAVITAFTGVSDLYEQPVKQALKVRADRGTVEDGIERVLVLRERGADA